MPAILRGVLTHGIRRITRHDTHIDLTRLRGLTETTSTPHNFTRTLVTRTGLGRPTIVTRVGGTSPDGKIVHRGFIPTSLTGDCRGNNTAYLSILASVSCFRNTSTCLRRTHTTYGLPIVHGSFVVSPCRVVRSHTLNTSYILLVISTLSSIGVTRLTTITGDINLSILIRIRSNSRLRHTLGALSAPLINIGGHGLRAFSIGLRAALSLLPHVPHSHLIVARDKVFGHTSIRLVRVDSICTFLINRTFVHTRDPNARLRHLFFPRHNDIIDNSALS